MVKQDQPAPRKHKELVAEMEQMERVEDKIAFATEHGLVFGRRRLKEEFSLVPRKDAEPAMYVRNPVYATAATMALFRVSDCRALQSNGQRRSPAQRWAAELQRLRGQRERPWAQHAARMREALHAGRLGVLDTETTGLHEPEIIEIAVVDATGACVFRSQVRPKGDIHPAAAQVHGLTRRKLRKAPPWSQVAPHLAEALEAHGIGFLAAFNADFDLSAYLISCEIHELHGDLARNMSWACVMEAAAGAAGREGPTMSLSHAVEYFDVTADGPAHTALADARMALGVAKGAIGVLDALEHSIEHAEHEKDAAKRSK